MRFLAHIIWWRPLRRSLWELGIQYWRFDGLPIFTLWGLRVLPTEAQRKRHWPDDDDEEGEE